MKPEQMAFVIISTFQSIVGKDLAFASSLTHVNMIVKHNLLVTQTPYETGVEQQWPLYESYWKAVEQTIIHKAEQKPEKAIAE